MKSGYYYVELKDLEKAYKLLLKNRRCTNNNNMLISHFEKKHLNYFIKVDTIFFYFMLFDNIITYEEFPIKNNYYLK